MAEELVNVVGYYRWTNIYYSWPDFFAEKPIIFSILRSFLHPASMLHPDHPFFSEEINGVKLWIGV
jgi:hypothetical protein